MIQRVKDERDALVQVRNEIMGTADDLDSCEQSHPEVIRLLKQFLEQEEDKSKQSKVNKSKDEINESSPEEEESQGEGKTKLKLKTLVDREDNEDENWPE